MLGCSKMSASTRIAVVALLLCCLLSQVAHAQIFQHFFGGGSPFEQREQEAPPSGDAKWFNDRVAAATCTQFLCPRTLSCVPSPAHCPCPFPQQLRCPYPNGESGTLDDGGHVCVQEPNCDRVNNLRRLGSDFKLSSLKA